MANNDNGKAPQAQLTAPQAIIHLTFELQMNQLMGASEQLRINGHAQAATFLRTKADEIARCLNALHTEWRQAIQVVPAGALPLIKG